MPAQIKYQPLPDGSPQFVFCTEEHGGHGDLIGGVNEFDEFLQSAIELAVTQDTPLGQSIEQADYNTAWLAATGRIR